MCTYIPTYGRRYVLLTKQLGFPFLLMQFPHTGTSGNHMVLMVTKAPKRKKKKPALVISKQRPEGKI
ncbi:hypothetical protein PITC_026260 [Penicillium italicum]|uniref:Uncharacterized protein n=1 Tax=Penicillium italicum TaxID=40296 RepID=A0A0A2KYC5_PENIT|nr:hypothetical protein PITC_026260 [Penicillium italicum]